MSRFLPTSLEVKDRETVMDELISWLNGSAVAPSDLLERYPVSELRSLAQAALGKMAEATPTERMRYSHIIALYRDAAMVDASRGELLAGAMQANLVELAEGAWLAETYPST